MPDPLYTPQEAAERLCPQMLQFIGPGEPTPECFCRGVRCMVWRWSQADPAAKNLRRRGYCGLAGE